MVHAGETDARKKNTASQSYDAVVVLSFGGPEGPEDVLPF
jgi:hypothetical protein